jgi:hypothetical protein
MGEIDEERFVFVGSNEFHGFFREETTQGSLLVHIFDDIYHFSVLENGEIGKLPSLEARPHVVGVGDPIVGSEPLRGR